VIGCSALAYCSRPEGLLLPATLIVTLVLHPHWVLGQRCGRWAVAGLLLGSICLIGPYIAMKGGVGTKPSIARLLGTAPRSDAHAVERQRPLEPGQSDTITYLLAGKAVAKAVVEAITPPLLPFALLAVSAVRFRGEYGRMWTFNTILVSASLFALLRLHATGGYCSARHALIIALIALPAAAHRLSAAIALLNPKARFAAWAVAFLTLMGWYAAETLSPLNEGMGGYREAAGWLKLHAAEDSMIIDVTGWSQFYSQRGGYTFANLEAAPGDARSRWVVAREAHLKGPWLYCQRLRALIDGREPVQVFNGRAGHRPTKVYVFDRQQVLSQRSTAQDRELLR
jgi:hypothetical protein